MFKLGALAGEEWVEHSHPPVFQIERARVLATAPGGDPLIIQRLARCLAPPFFLLYVLHTPRGEGEPGRYQSPEISLFDLDTFLSRFEGFLRADARFDLWPHSANDQATVVWDRHNLIYGYGRTDCMAKALRALGFVEGEPTVPSPHEHHYHAALDSDAREILTYMKWTCSPLEPEDEQ